MSDEKDINVTAENEAVEADVAAAQDRPSEMAEDVSGEESASEADDSKVVNESDASEADDSKVVNESDASEEDAEAAMMAMLEDMPADDQKAGVDDIEFPATSVSNAQFQQLSEPSAPATTRNIDLLMDVNLPISIELGRTRMSISDILALGPGSVVELAKLAGEPVDVLVNQKIIARGEVVVIDENFGVRVTQLMTPEERLKTLGEEQ